MPTERKCTDMSGTEIEVGDLVVSGGRVGIVYEINQHDAPSIRVRSKRNVYAYEWGAPPIQKEGERIKYDSYGRYVRNSAGGYVRENYTYEERDRRVVGERDYTYNIIRQRTYDVAVIRKKDGSTPNPFASEVEFHKQIFPGNDL